MPPNSPGPPRRSLLPVVSRGCVAGVALTLILHVGYVLFGSNFHTVLPGAVYRCAQPSPADLEWAVRKLGVRTVINLRGCCDPAPWYLEQCRATNRLNISQEDLGFSSARLPSVPTIRQLLEVLERSEYPILVHCHKGADRTGMVSVMALLLRTATPLAEARKQLGFRYGHLRVGRAGHIDRFFDLYEEWLAARGAEHSPALFRNWVAHEYCPGECRADILALDGAGRGPTQVPCCRPFPLRVRCTNTSVKPWHFQPGTNAGIHATYLLHDSADRFTCTGRAGMFYATVPPGGHIDLTLALPALSPGRYALRVDLADEQHGSFLQLGSEPLFWELEVP